MKTYYLIYAFLVCAIVSCNKSDNNDGENGNNLGKESTYNLLVLDDGIVSSTLIKANKEEISLNSAASNTFNDMPIPDLAYKDGTILTSYHQDSDCTGKLSQFDFGNNSSKNVILFSELSGCKNTTKAIAHSAKMLYVAFSLENASSTSDYFIRVIDPTKTDSNFIDVALKAESFDPTYIPVELVFANNKLFILVHDEDITNEFSILVMDGTTNEIIQDINLGFDVKQIFKNPADNIVVSYNESHSELNSNSMNFINTNYREGTEPNFMNSKYNHFDKTGRMYYEMPPGSLSSYSRIPAVYDFKENMAIIYAYENFLSETQRNVIYNIENTTMVCFDEKNEFILIGYKKSGSENKGGLMRIKPTPDPEFIDNLNVDGIPYKLFAN